MHLETLGAEKAVRRQRIRHPERIVPIAFLCGIAIGTILLLLPLSRAGVQHGDPGAPFLTALFTATSAFCVTGLGVVDAATYWSPFGHAVILLLAQVGGFGIMTGATLLGLLITGRNRLSGRLVARLENRSLELGDIAAVVRLVLISTLIIEAVLTLWIASRLHFGLQMSLGDALWIGLFHAVGSFNNAGVTNLPAGLLPHSGDILLLSPLVLGVILGGIGFPVLFELRREWRRPASWSVHTKLTLLGTLGLLLAGFIVVAAAEWHNPETFGPLSAPAKLFNAFFHSAMTRSGGFNAVDIGAMNPETLFLSTGLMLIGGGSASTAGGIKVTTFLLLGFVVWAEVRGLPDTVVFRRRIATEVQRQALAIVLLSLAIIAMATLLLLATTRLPLVPLLFEVVSAFATTGLSTGLTSQLPPHAVLVLSILMFVGRVGTITFATALALRVRRMPWRYPVERPIVG